MAENDLYDEAHKLNVYFSNKMVELAHEMEEAKKTHYEIRAEYSRKEAELTNN